MTLCRRFARTGHAAPAPPPRLLACPFCGGAAAREAHPSLADAVRIACAGEACPVRPATEYLLAEYAAELDAAWNRRRG
jgi:hypothetical protein